MKLGPTLPEDLLTTAYLVIVLSKINTVVEPFAYKISNTEFTNSLILRTLTTLTLALPMTIKNLAGLLSSFDTLPDQPAMCSTSSWDAGFDTGGVNAAA